MICENSSYIDKSERNDNLDYFLDLIKVTTVELSVALVLMLITNGISTLCLACLAGAVSFNGLFAALFQELQLRLP